MCIYSENPTTRKRSQHIANGVALSQKLGTPDLQLRFAKKLCAVGNLRFLGIFDAFFEIHKATLKQTPKQRGVNVAWLQRLTFCERESSALYEALFNDGTI